MVDFVAYDLNDFAKWLVQDNQNEKRQVWIANEQLTMGILSEHFNDTYIVVSPVPKPPPHALRKFSPLPKPLENVKPWLLQLRLKSAEDNLSGQCTCETPFCHIRKGEKHVPNYTGNAPSPQCTCETPYCTLVEGAKHVKINNGSAPSSSSQCTCETPFCSLRKGEKHIPTHSVSK